MVVKETTKYVVEAYKLMSKVGKNLKELYLEKVIGRRRASSTLGLQTGNKLNVLLLESSKCNGRRNAGGDIIVKDLVKYDASKDIMAMPTKNDNKTLIGLVNEGFLGSSNELPLVKTLASFEEPKQNYAKYMHSVRSEPMLNYREREPGRLLLPEGDTVEEPKKLLKVMQSSERADDTAAGSFSEQIIIEPIPGRETKISKTGMKYKNIGQYMKATRRPTVIRMISNNDPELQRNYDDTSDDYDERDKSKAKQPRRQVVPSKYLTAGDNFLNKRITEMKAVSEPVRPVKPVEILAPPIPTSLRIDRAEVARISKETEKKRQQVLSIPHNIERNLNKIMKIKKSNQMRMPAQMDFEVMDVANKPVLRTNYDDPNTYFTPIIDTEPKPAEEYEEMKKTTYESTKYGKDSTANIRRNYVKSTTPPMNYVVRNVPPTEEQYGNRHKFSKRRPKFAFQVDGAKVTDDGVAQDKFNMWRYELSKRSKYLNLPGPGCKDIEDCVKQWIVLRRRI